MPIRLAGCSKSPPAAFSLRSEAQRTEAYAFASLLTAALLDGLFEHPARCSPVVPDMWLLNLHRAAIVFSQPTNPSKLVNQRRDLDGFLNQTIACKRLQRHRQHARVDHVHRDNLKALSDFVPFNLHGMTDFEFFPNQII
jgi:hypothetical protein